MTRSVRLAAAAVLAILLVSGPGAAAAVTPSPPATGPNPIPTSAASTATTPMLPVSVQLDAIGPRAPQPGDVLRLRGRLRNDSSSAVSSLGLQFRYRPGRIGSRSEFADYARGSGAPPGGGGSPLPLPPVVAGTARVAVPAHTIAVGATVPFEISVPVDDLHLDQSWQVYEIGVQVNGATAAGYGVVGGLRTFLPWAPVDANGNGVGVGVPVQVAWVWPLVDRPHRTVGGSWTDDQLAAAVAATGRLRTLLDAGVQAQDQQQQPAPASTGAKKRKKTTPPRHVVMTRSVPVTWAVDPLLVEDVADMSNGYRVGHGGATVAGTGASAARSWLDGLRAAVTKGQTLALPYADPDVVAATRGSLAPEVQAAIHSGSSLVSSALSTTPLTYGWPANGLVDQRTLDTLFAAGVNTVLLDGTALPPVTEPPFTPGAHTTVRARDGNLDALLTDTGLDTVVGIGAADSSKQPLAVQRFAAELLLIQAELPNQQRTIVVAPDRRWAPSAGYATDLLTTTGKVPWVRPVPLSSALDDAPSATIARQPLMYPAQARRAELPRRYLASVNALKMRADAFAAILPRAGDPHARAFDDAVLRTLSASWRGQGAARAAYLDAVTANLESTMRKVRIASLPNSFVTLTSHSGTVPVTVANELDTPVRVLVQIKSQHLRVSGGGRKAETIPPHRQIAVDVRADAQTSGVFPLTVRLLTPDGRLYQSTGLFVRSTAYGVVAILITAIATGVLLLAVVVRLVRRALAARRSSRSSA